jgi:hypothetical protein
MNMMPANIRSKARSFCNLLLRDPKWAIRRLRGYLNPPLFIFQMGKVGSRTITNTVETRYRVCHFHTSGEFEKYSAMFWTKKQTGESGGYIDMITATRDPIGREVSAFFQNITNMSHSWGVGSREEVLAMSAEELIGKFFERWDKGAINTTIWFDRHFKSSTGIDIYAHPFDPKTGWSIIRDGAWRVLIVRFEDINRNYLEACNAFVRQRFGESATYPALLPANMSDDKWYGPLMLDFKKNIRFTPEQIASQYESRYCRHFYSPEEIERMKAKWNVAC